jgi:deazaflavin-dependent oxidoreductase (nitroreductase family)
VTLTAAIAPPRPTTARNTGSTGSTHHAGLAPEPPSGPLSDFARRSFKVLNRWFMLPLLRAGLGAWMGTPLGGWILLLHVRGRRSGVMRDSPLSYLIADGAVWVMAGFGDKTQWYRNLLADPDVRVVLPGRAISCTAEVVADPEVRRRIIPQLARAAGLPGYLTGVDPFRAPPEQVLAATAWVPLIRLRPDDGPISAGPDDPGGLGWIWRQGLVLIVGALLIRRLRGLLRG